MLEFPISYMPTEIIIPIDNACSDWYDWHPCLGDIVTILQELFGLTKASPGVQGSTLTSAIFDLIKIA